MAQRYPRAQYRPLGRQTQNRMVAHDIVCLHTMVSSLAACDRYFRLQGYGGTESHYGVGDRTDPRVLQWQDRAYRADANLEGNPRVISVETADTRGEFGRWTGVNVPAWSSWQLQALEDLLVWECSRAAHVGCPPSWRCHQVGIPAVLIPDTRPGRRGIGYHRQGVDPWRVAGGEVWSRSRGKVCPGDRRVKQIPALVDRVAARLAPPAPKPPAKPAPPKEDDDVTPEDIKAIADAVTVRVWDRLLYPPKGGQPAKWPAHAVVRNAAVDAEETRQRVVRVENLVTAQGRMLATATGTLEALAEDVADLAAKLDELTAQPELPAEGTG
jgi:hypothetical protein